MYIGTFMSHFHCSASGEQGTFGNGLFDAEVIGFISAVIVSPSCLHYFVLR